MLSSLGYDIFRTAEDGSVIWVGDAATLDEAKQNLNALRAAKPGTYFVRDAATGKLVNDQDRGTLNNECV
jgi:hypothetical protein